MADAHSLSDRERDINRSPVPSSLSLMDPGIYDDDIIDDTTPTNTDIPHIGDTSWEESATPTHDTTPTEDSRRKLLYSYSSLPDPELITDDDDSEPSRGSIKTRFKKIFSRKKKYQSDLTTIYSEGTYHSATDHVSQKRRSASLESTSLKSWRLFPSRKISKSRHHSDVTPYSSDDQIYDTLPVQPVVVLKETREHISHSTNI